MDKFQFSLSEYLAHLFSMLCGLLAILQVPQVEGGFFYSFALLQDLVTGPEVDFGGVGEGGFVLAISFFCAGAWVLRDPFV